jgi:hypothetical protein
VRVDDAGPGARQALRSEDRHDDLVPGVPEDGVLGVRDPAAVEDLLDRR